MNTDISDWNFEGDLPIIGQKNLTGADHDLVELLWRNGQVVLQSQTHRKQASNILSEPSSQVLQNPIRPRDEETVSWVQYPIEDSFEREFCSGFFSGSPACDPMDSDSQMPPPRAVNFRVDSSHCGSNQPGPLGKEAKIVPRGEISVGTETIEPTVTSSSGGSGSSFGRATTTTNTTTTSGNTNNKRKCREAELECQSEAAELESEPMYKSAQQSGTSRKSRAAEVHNLSERRRRDRINEKMKALQELIPHSNKTDKASMLDEAIQYLKSLQSQLQVMWMGSGVTPMMFPGVQAHYMLSRMGPPSMPGAMHLPPQAPHGSTIVGPAPDQYSALCQAQAAFINPLSYQTHPMQSASFAEQYARFMPMHVFRFSPQTVQQQGQLMAQQLISNSPSIGGAQINGGLNGKNMG